MDYKLVVPNGAVIFDAATTTPSTSFQENGWLTWVPAGFAKQIFLTGVPFQVPEGGLPGGIKAVSWSGTFYGTPADASVSWKWAAAVYSQFDNLPLDDLNGLAVKPVEGKVTGFPEKHLPGTPEGYVSSVVGGARGGGGSNYTGGYSGSQTLTLLPHTKD